MLDERAPALAPQADMAFRDEDGEVIAAFVARVSLLVAAGDHDGLVAVAGQLHEADLGGLLEALEPEDRPKLIEILGKDFDFTALTEVDDAVREEILEELEPETVAEGMRDLDSDDAVYILEDMDDADKAEILDKLPASERIALQKSLDYPDDSAGRRMQTEVIAVPAFWTVGQTIDFMRDTQDLPETFYEIYVVDPAHHFKGTVALDKLLRSKRPVRIAALADPERKTVAATDELTDVAQMFKRYNFVSAPVVDEAERLVGVMTIDDIVDILDAEADDEIKALGGVKGDEELSDTVPAIARSRFQWLFINLLTAFFAASVMKLFSGSLEKMVALAVLAPVVASQGGNAATQTMTVAVRALATGELGNWNMSRFVTRELTVSLINGAAFALITGVVAAFWFGNQGLGLVIGLAIIVNLFAAALAGAAIPIALDKLGIDPAVSSGTFVTTVTDVVGFFAFLGIATLWFGF
ncbi:MAG: magnesium transporter [Beijerinckiaceae bacterium]|jgi:magnesium transporter|nr:magnesium transporter [Beijerinckiaceae bacterium]